VNIGLAVGIEDGLVVPVLLDAGRMTLAELAANTKRIVAGAARGQTGRRRARQFSPSPT